MYRSFSTIVISTLSLKASLSRPFPTPTPTHNPTTITASISPCTVRRYTPPQLQLPPPTTTNMTTPSPNREKLTYPIPSTDLILHLTLGLDLPLSFASIRSSLNGALAIASSHSPQSLTPPALVRFRQAEGVRDGDATFGIVGEVVFDCNELSWGDVVEALRGLGWWYDERILEGEEGIEIWFKLVEGGEEGRGEVGAGFLRRREVEEEGRQGVVDIGEGSSV